METMKLTFSDIAHVVNTYFSTLKTFSKQSLLRLFEARENLVKFHFAFCNERRPLKSATL